MKLDLYKNAWKQLWDAFKYYTIDMDSFESLYRRNATLYSNRGHMTIPDIGTRAGLIAGMGIPSSAKSYKPLGDIGNMKMSELYEILYNGVISSAAGDTNELTYQYVNDDSTWSKLTSVLGYKFSLGIGKYPRIPLDIGVFKERLVKRQYGKTVESNSAIIARFNRYINEAVALNEKNITEFTIDSVGRVQYSGRAIVINNVNVPTVLDNTMYDWYAMHYLGLIVYRHENAVIGSFTVDYYNNYKNNG